MYIEQYIQHEPTTLTCVPVSKVQDVQNGRNNKLAYTREDLTVYLLDIGPSFLHSKSLNYMYAKHTLHTTTLYRCTNIGQQHKIYMFSKK